MLNRAVSSPTWTPSRWTDWRSGLSARQAALVRRYVLLVVILSALGCLYLWQVNVITDLRQETWKMHAETEEIEGANAVSDGTTGAVGIAEPHRAGRPAPRDGGEPTRRSTFRSRPLASRL